MPTVTNSEIDTWILAHIQKEKKEFPQERVTNLGLGFALLHSFRDRLPRTDKNHWKPKSELHNAQEVANRSCQRLRKTGRLTFSPTQKWELAKK